MISKKILILLCLAVMINIYFTSFVVSSHQTEWWDATEYLLKAKSMAKGTSDIGWAAHREIVPTLIWYPFFKLGLGELGIRAFMVLVSLAGVYILYLLGKSMFNENVGFIAALMLATFNTYLFNTNRLTMYCIALVIFESAIYFFWRYHKFKDAKGIYISFILAGIGLTIYYSTALTVFVIGAYLLFINRKFYKDKHIWLAGLLTLLVLSPYFIYSMVTFGHPIPRLAETQRAAAAETGAPFFQAITSYPKIMISMLQPPWLLLFLVGLMLCYKLIMGLDLVLKGKLEEERPKLLLSFWMIIPFSIYTWTVMKLAGGSVVMPEYIMVIFPAMFLLMANAIDTGYEKIRNINAALAIVVVTIILITGIYFQLNMATSLIGSKVELYKEIQEAAEIIKTRTQQTDYVVTASVPQMVYYSERPVLGIGRDWTKQRWLDYITPNKPKYLFWSMYEPHPDWFMSYLQEAQLTPIKAWGTNEQPIAVLFTFPEEK